MIVFITYSNELYKKTRDYCVAMALKKGKVDKAIAYKPEDIDEGFYQKNKSTLLTRRGNGLWLWKPYFICKALDSVADDDIVLYCDAGSFFYRNCKYIINSMDDDVWVSDIPLIEKQFTKPELLEKLGCTSEEFTETNQVQANFIAIRKTKRGLKFAHEWLDICVGKGNLSMETRYDESPPDFVFCAHRSDQSALSLLAKKWKLKVHRDPSQFGRVPTRYYVEGIKLYDEGIMLKIPNHFDSYPCCIILHRTNNADFIICVKQWVFTWIPMPMTVWILSFNLKTKLRGKIGS